LPEETPPRPLAPSKAIIAEPAALSPLQEDGKNRYQRGIIIHRLLQSLPDLPPARRRAAAEAFVKRPGWGLEKDAASAIVTETLAVLTEPAFAPLFAPGSKAEVSLTGLVGAHAISGQVDRLAVTADEVWIIDYKTNRPPPRDPAKVDAAYIFQMATYRAALQAIYPRHTVRCVLLWTDGSFTMELEKARMDDVLREAGLI
jgi:ATP-dependent helicase/nuclease subunit A